jgi:hypothetical protein
VNEKDDAEEPYRAGRRVRVSSVHCCRNNDGRRVGLWLSGPAEAGRAFLCEAMGRGDSWNCRGRKIAVQQDGGNRGGAVQNPRGHPGQPGTAAQNQELEQADTQLKKLESDSRMKESHPAIRRLRGFVEFRTSPDRRACQFAVVAGSGNHTEGRLGRLYKAARSGIGRGSRG